MTRKKALGLAVLALAIIGGSSLGVLSNYTVPPKPASLAAITKPVAVTQAPKKTKGKKHHKKVQVVIEKDEPGPPFLLINAWRFQILTVLFLAMSPALYIYEKNRRKYERLYGYLNILKTGRYKGKFNLDFMSPEQIEQLEKQLMSGSAEKELKQLVEFAEMNAKRMKLER